MTTHPAIRWIALRAGHSDADNTSRKHLQDKGWHIVRITD